MTPPATKISALPYRLGVGICLINRRGLVFVARRIDTPGDAWQMPQGGIDEGEEPEATAFRELEEEIGTARAETLGETRDWPTYDLPEDVIGKVWGGRYRGQRQKWFLMRFVGDDAEIRLDAHKPEFDRWRWAAADDLTTLIVPFKRPLYEAVLAEFRGKILPDTKDR